jgi:ABC-type polysaccharide/polyol phosphate export permease
MRSTLSNLWSRRNLLRVLVTSNLKRQNKNSVLGYLWWLLDPILLTCVFYVVVAVLFRRGEGNQPYILFLIIGLLSWKAFSDSVGQSVNSIRGQASIIKSIGFPKAVLTLSLVLSNTINFLFALVVIVAMGLWYGGEYDTWPNVYYLMLPVVIGLQVLFTAGVAFVVSALGLLFQDTGNIVSHLLRIWYFMSPGLYGIDLVPEKYQAIYRLNPFCELMTSYRDILMKGRMPDWYDLGYALAVGLLSCLVGYYLFKRYEGRFVQKL